MKRIGIFLSIGICTLLNAYAIHAQFVNKPSIQITLRTNTAYYRNGQRYDSTWSWTPRIVYRVNGPISAGSQLSVEFTQPSGKPWVKLNCNTN